LLQALWQRFAPRGAATVEDWLRQVADDLVAAGALRRTPQNYTDA